VVVLRNILIVVGCIALLAGLTLATLWFTRAPVAAGSASQAAPPSGILVAARPLADGTLLQPADTAWKEIPAGTEAAGSIVRSPATETAFHGAVTRRDFSAGEALIESALVKAGDRTFLSAVLSPGSRAVSVAVDAPQSVAGLVLPGDRVDVILTQNFGTDPADPGRKAVGETVLKNIRVIAVDQWLNTIAKPTIKDQHVGAANADIPATITLEVNDSQAERLLVAVQIGKIQLAVRALEGSGAAQLAASRAEPPMWAADVSPALHNLGRDVPQSSSTPVQQGVVYSPRSQRSRESIEVMHGPKTEIR
jgi:pilus assembly protein CpaB